MKRLLLVLVMVSLPVAVFAQAKDPEKFEAKFASGGHIRLRLGAGDMKIVGSPEEQIIVRYEANYPRDVKVTLHASDSEAEVSVYGPRNNFHVTIQVPEKSDLLVRMSAGALQIKGVTGSKDAELHAGDIDIQIGNPEQYAYADGSVNMGGLDAPPFHVEKGGIARSFEHSGSGKYRVHAHVGMGQVTLH